MSIQQFVDARFGHLEGVARAKAIGRHSEELTAEACEIVDASERRKLTDEEIERAEAIASYFEWASAGYDDEPDVTAVALRDALRADRHRVEAPKKPRKPANAAELRAHLQSLGYSRREAATIAGRS